MAACSTSGNAGPELDHVIRMSPRGAEDRGGGLKNKGEKAEFGLVFSVPQGYIMVVAELF